MKNILVTGGAGFIGANLCRKLINDGNNVICMDNFHTGKLRNVENIDSDCFKVIEHDIINPIKIDFDIDEIYNLACPASPPHYQKAPIQTTKTNVVGIINLLELANQYDAKILQTSTSEIYGEPHQHPQKESYWGNVNPIGIRSCYDEGKRCAESLCFSYNKEFETKIKIVRIFNTYGPFMDPLDGRVVTNFIIQSLKNEDITVYGNGTQTRSFCYVDDMIDGLIAMMNSNDAFLGPVNLGNPNEFTILELAEKIIDKTNSNSKIKYCPLPEDDPTIRKPDISLANEKLKWQPKIMLNEGLDETINYYKDVIN